MHTVIVFCLFKILYLRSRKLDKVLKAKKKLKKRLKRLGQNCKFYF